MELVPELWHIFVFKLLILEANWLKLQTPFRRNLRKHHCGIGPLSLHIYVQLSLLMYSIGSIPLICFFLDSV